MTQTAASFQLRALGGLELRSPDGAEIQAVIAQPKRLALLLYLATADPRPPLLHRRDTLRALFWPEGNDGHARHALNRATYFLRHALGHAALLSRGDDELGISDQQLWCDAIAFEEAVIAGRSEDALALYRGDFAPAFYLNGLTELERWIESKRKRLRDLAIASALRLSQQEVNRANLSLAERWARHAGTLAPYDERVICALVGILDRVGNRASALQAYDDFACRLREELDVDPAPETQAAVATIRTRTAPRSSTLEPRHNENPPPGRAALLRSVPWMAALLGGIIAVYAFVAGPSRGMPRINPDALVVLPFAVSGPPEAAYLKTGMADLLAMALDGVARWRVIHPRTVLAQLTDSLDVFDQPRVAREVRAFGAGTLVLGSVVAIGTDLRFNAELFDASGRLLGRAQARGTLVNPGPAIDSIAAALAKWRLKEHPGRLPRSVAEYATTSAEALRAFLVAEELIRRAEWRPAADSLARAISLDPAFGLAYFRQYLVHTYGASVETFLSDFHPLQLLDRALPFLDRMPARDRDLLLIARAEQLGLRSEALSLANRLEQRYPDDPEAALQAGEEYFHFGLLAGDSTSHALEAFDRALRLAPGWLEPTLHAVELMAIKGDTARAWVTLRRALALAPANDQLRGLEIAMRVAVDEVDPDSLAEALQAREWESRGPRAEWEILRILADDPARAIGKADSLAIRTAAAGRPVPERVAAWHRRAAYRLAQGRYDDAWQALQQAVRLAPGDPVTDARIAAYAFRTAQHRTEGWDAAAAVLTQDTTRRFLPRLLMAEQQFISSDDAALSRTLDRLPRSCWWARHGCLRKQDYALAVRAGFRGLIALRRGDSAVARRLLARAYEIREIGEPYRPHLPDPAFSLQLARLEYAAGQLSPAVQHLADLFLPEALIYHAEGLELRAQIAEQRGDTADAIKLNQRFVNLWENADAMLQPRVQHGREVIARLIAHR